MSRPADVDVAALEADGRVRWSEDVIRYGDVDMNRHVNNAAFAVFCESGRVNLVREVSRPMREHGGFFVVARLLIEFRGELHYPGRVRCGTWIAATGRSSVTFRQVLLGPSGDLAATSEAVTVALDAATRRPAPLDAATLALIDPFLRPE